MTPSARQKAIHVPLMRSKSSVAVYNAVIGKTAQRRRAETGELGNWVIGESGNWIVEYDETGRTRSALLILFELGLELLEPSKVGVPLPSRNMTRKRKTRQDD